jgi:glycosyltransferase domain-containing protein
MKDLLTIIILLHNRHDKVLRLLQYLGELQFPLKTYVFDSSKNKIRNSEINAFFKHAQVEYYRFPPDYRLAQKLHKGSEYIKTPYCVMCGDDDFIIPNAAIECAQFLQENEDFEAAMGKYLYFSDNVENINWHKAPFTTSVNSNYAEERLQQHLTNYIVPTFYAVHRTALFSVIWEEAARHTTDPRFQELLPTMLTAIHGKIEYMDFFVGAREYSLISESKSIQRITDYIAENTFYPKYDKFKNVLVKELLNQTTLTKIKIERDIFNSFRKYIKVSFLRIKTKYYLKQFLEKFRLSFLLKNNMSLLKPSNQKQNPVILTFKNLDKKYSIELKLIKKFAEDSRFHTY